MFDPKNFDEIAKKLYETLPDGVKNIEQDLQQKFKTVLLATFDKLDLVTREEFDIQMKVLQRTRAKVEAIEKQLNDSQKTEDS